MKSMIAWGCWDVLPMSRVAVYLCMARCGSSCDHRIRRAISAVELESSVSDVINLVHQEFEAAFDYAHDSVPEAMAR